MTPDQEKGRGTLERVDPDIAFLEEAARYFEQRPTNGEDRAYWANAHNAENCRRIAARLHVCDLKEHRDEVLS